MADKFKELNSLALHRSINHASYDFGWCATFEYATAITE